MNNQQSSPYLKLLGDGRETKRGVTTVVAPDKATSRAITHEGKNWAQLQELALSLLGHVLS